MSIDQRKTLVVKQCVLERDVILKTHHEPKTVT